MGRDVSRETRVTCAPRQRLEISEIPLDYSPTGTLTVQACRHPS